MKTKKDLRTKDEPEDRAGELAAGAAKQADRARLRLVERHEQPDDLDDLWENVPV